MHFIKALALDLDGTLLNSRGRISSITATYLQKLRAEGVTLVLASGRMTHRMMPAAEILGPPLTLISYNGARISRWEKGQTWATEFATVISPETRRRVLKLCEKRAYFLNIYAGEDVFGYHPNRDFHAAEFYTGQNGAQYAGFFAHIEDIPAEAIAKLLIITTPEDREKLYRECLEEFGNLCSILKSNPEYLEFMAVGTTKGSALGQWLQSQSFSASQMAAFGDAENDLDMLQAVGHGYAVANATPGLKNAYARISPFNHDEDVIVRELESILAKDLSKER